MTELLAQALNAPGKLSATYSLFYDYSISNQIWLWLQGVDEPCGPFGFWKTKFGRIAQAGTAKSVLHPVFFTKYDKDTKQPVLDKNGRKVQYLARFTPKRTVFKYSDTVGPDVQWPELPTWDLQMALDHLGVEKIRFSNRNGNTQGYSQEKTFAISPVADEPWRTTFHELAHIVLGHTTKEGLADYRAHRGIMEFQAEATAHILANELELIDWNASSSRAYIQTWLGGNGEGEITDAHVRAVFGAANKILLAGRPQRKADETKE